MDKTQALQAFWAGFDLPAYQAETVPEGLETPYITYEVATGRLGGTVALTASVWDRGTSWEAVQAVADRIGRHLAREHVPMPLDGGGYLWLRQGTPFARWLRDPEDDALRRVVLNVEAEFAARD